jgi:hypothetical protein
VVRECMTFIVCSVQLFRVCRMKLAKAT